MKIRGLLLLGVCAACGGEPGKSPRSAAGSGVSTSPLEHFSFFVTSYAGFMPGEADGVNWMSSLNEAGCAAGASLVEMGPPDSNNPTVGSGGGYGGIYCFALEP